MALVDLGLIDQVDDVVGAMPGHIRDGADFWILLCASGNFSIVRCKACRIFCIRFTWSVTARVRLEYWMSFCRLDTSIMS